MKKLNNKGYMLVEIILASVLAFGVAYFIIDLTIKLKNKNDDLFVETQVTTDQAIISNKLMEYIKDEGKEFDCSKLAKNNKTITYNNEKIDIVNDYASIGNISCKNELGLVSIDIPLSIIQMNNKDYDIKIDYKYEIGDMTSPTCTLKVEGTNILFATKDDDVVSYGLVKGTTSSYDNNDSITISGVDTYTGFVKDNAGNQGECSVDVVDSSYGPSYTCKKNFDACPSGWTKQDNGCFHYTNCLQATYEWACHDMAEFKKTNTSTNPNPIYCNLVNSYCSSCQSGYSDYGSTQYCSKTANYSECSSGTKKSDGCYLYNQTSCPSGFSSNGPTTNYTCPSSEYTVTSNNEYCYKIN